MIYELSNAFGSRVCSLNYSPEEWRRIASRTILKRRGRLFSRLLRGVLIALVALFGHLPPLWKYLLLAMAALSFILGFMDWFGKPAVMDADGNILREKEFDAMVSGRLLSYFRTKNRNYGSCARITDFSSATGETEKIPLSVFIPSAAKEKRKPDLRSVLLLSGLALVLSALLFFLIRNWVRNVVDSTILTTFVYAELGLAALLFFARPKIRARRICVALLCAFLFVFFGLHVYSGILSSRCLDLADSRTDFSAGASSGAFIVRYAEDGSRAVIYALPGDPSACAFYVIADPDTVSGSADYTGSVTVRVQVFSAHCTVYSSSDRTCVTAFDTGVSLPEQVSVNQSYDLHPDNVQIIQTSLAVLGL